MEKEPIVNKLNISNESFEREFTNILLNFLDSNKKTLIVPVSGFSGVGKSTFIRKIKEISNVKGVPFLIIRNDIFIGTESGTNERKYLLNSSWKNFRELFYNKNKINELVKKIITSDGGKIELKNTYRRFDENKEPHGKFDGIETFSIPDEKFIIILDGVNSVEYAHEAKGPNCEISGFTITDDPAESLLRATFRDANKKEKNFEDIFKQRINEYFYMQFWIKNNLANSTKIDNDDLSHITKKLIQEYSEKNKESLEEIKQRMEIILEEFKTKKVQKYPKKYSEFSNNLIDNLIKREL